MRPIPFQARMEALELYLEGLSADKIVEKTSISKGAVVSIIKDAREGKYPPLDLKGKIDELHNMAVRLRKEKLDLAQASLGFSFLQRILSIGVSPDKLEEWIAFCSEVSPTPPEGFIPAAMELLRVEKGTGLSYGELAAQVKKLADKRHKLIDAVAELQAKEKRYSELMAEIERNEKRASELRVQRDKLEGEVNFLGHFIEKRAEALGIAASELEAKFKELINLDVETADKRSEYNRLQGEVEALSERHAKLSCQMEKAAADFERDIRLIRQTRQVLTEIAEMKPKPESSRKLAVNLALN